MIEIIDKSNIKENDKQRILAYMKEEEFTGPLPPPVTLQQYEEVQAGFADKIFPSFCFLVILFNFSKMPSQ